MNSPVIHSVWAGSNVKPKYWPRSITPTSLPSMTFKKRTVRAFSSWNLSREQAKGKTVDKRADIWAFGVVLYEMLTGKMLFSGETVSETMAFVMTKELDWDTLPANIPLRIRELLHRCVVKEPRNRIRDIG